MAGALDWKAILRRRAEQTRKLADLKGEAEEGVLSETMRVVSLPTWDPEMFEAPDLTDRYARPDGLMRLKPLQNLSLHWMAEVGGLLGVLPVGSGKTLLSLLAPRALGASRPLLLVRPSMRGQLDRDIKTYRQHFDFPLPMVVSYSQLSIASGSDLLLALHPDLIVADEAQDLANFDAARTKRFLRYFESQPYTKFVGLTGTVSKRSLRDYAHLAELALGKGSPLPRSRVDLDAWANVVDRDGTPRNQDWCVFEPIAPGVREQEEARTSYQNRFRSTRGVVSNPDKRLDVNLVFRERPLTVPAQLQATIDEFEEFWTRPDGEELMSALDAYRVAGDLSCGFYYRWVWPDGNVDRDWLLARARWHKFVRGIVQQNRAGLDSPLLVYNAVADERLRDPTGASLLAGWLEQKLKFRPAPPTESVWLDEFMVDDIVAWAHEEGGRGRLAWYSDRAVGKRLAERGLRVFGPGEELPQDGKFMACSLASHGTGKNLQPWHKNLFSCFPSDGAAAEQNVGRTHRQGQLAEEVEVWYYGHTTQARRAVRMAEKGARYIEQTTGLEMKMLYGTWEDPSIFLEKDGTKTPVKLPEGYKHWIDANPGE